MRSADLRGLPEGSYVIARVGDIPEPETVRLLGVRETNEEEVRRGHTTNRVEIRRFLLGGWTETWVYPRDVLEVTEPNASVLSAIRVVEEKVGPKR